MARPKNPKPQGKRMVYFDQELFDYIDLMHIDSLTGQPKKGAFSHYIKRLVQRDFEQRRRATAERKRNAQENNL